MHSVYLWSRASTNKTAALAFPTSIRIRRSQAQQTLLACFMCPSMSAHETSLPAQSMADTACLPSLGEWDSR